MYFLWLCKINSPVRKSIVIRISPKSYLFLLYLSSFSKFTCYINAQLVDKNMFVFHNTHGTRFLFALNLKSKLNE